MEKIKSEAEIPVLASNSGNNKAVTVQQGSPMEVADPIPISADTVNRCEMGHFGWEVFPGKHDDKVIPYIYRSTEKFCSVKMLEKKLLSEYLACFHQDIFSCALVQAYYATACESNLLTDININHSNSHYGEDTYRVGDLLVRLDDAKHFYEFMFFCYRKLVCGDTNLNEICGFIRKDKQNVLAYIRTSNNRRLIPSFYFDADNVNASLRKHEITGWDFIYLRLCCRIQGVEEEIVGPAITAIDLFDNIGFFPKNSIFEDYWPSEKDKQIFSSLLQPTTFIRDKIFIKNKITWTKPPIEDCAPLASFTMPKALEISVPLLAKRNFQIFPWEQVRQT